MPNLLDAIAAVQAAVKDNEPSPAAAIREAIRDAGRTIAPAAHGWTTARPMSVAEKLSENDRTIRRGLPITNAA